MNRKTIEKTNEFVDEFDNEWSLRIEFHYDWELTPESEFRGEWIYAYFDSEATMNGELVDLTGVCRSCFESFLFQEIEKMRPHPSDL